MNIPMKKTVILFIVSFGLSISALFSQEISYDIKITYKDTQVSSTADIKIAVSKGTPYFTFYLMTNDPVHGEIIRKSDPINKKNYTFEDVQPGKYLIKIEDRNGMIAGKTVEIVTSENN